MGKLLSPAKKKQAVQRLQQRHSVSGRRICRILHLNRRTAHYVPVKATQEEPLVSLIIELACNYGRYGYRRIHVLLQRNQIFIGLYRMKRIWREQGLKVPKKQPKKRRLWLNDGSCIRLRLEYENQVWSYDFVEDRLSNEKDFDGLILLMNIAGDACSASPDLLGNI